ncbi:MAG: DUF4476 domain-containing protein [Bacteroidales bacterium]|nr:DUF4476 domain-containing protein [Bacteroidales bacterium]
MKTILVLIASLLIVNICSSQGLLTFFTKEGEKFWVIVDGKKINKEPQYLVENIPVNMKWGKVKIIFEDPKLGSVDKTYQVVDVDENWCHVKYMIRYNEKKKKYEIRDLDATFEVLSKTQPSQPAQPATTQPTPTAQPTQPTTPTQNNNINLNMSVTETPTGIQMQTGVSGVQQTTVVTHQTTTTTTTVPANTIPITQPVIQPASPSNTNCARPMNETDFQSALSSIKSKSFEDAKLTMAKQIASSNCLLATQVRDIMKSFGFENTRLEFAKYAYTYTYDKGNYFKVNDAFNFESSIEELNEYIQSVK